MTALSDSEPGVMAPGARGNSVSFKLMNIHDIQCCCFAISINVQAVWKGSLFVFKGLARLCEAPNAQLLIWHAQARKPDIREHATEPPYLPYYLFSELPIVLISIEMVLVART